MPGVRARAQHGGAGWKLTPHPAFVEVADRTLADDSTVALEPASACEQRDGEAEIDGRHLAAADRCEVRFGGAPPALAHVCRDQPREQRTSRFGRPARPKRRNRVHSATQRSGRSHRGKRAKRAKVERGIGKHNLIVANLAGAAGTVQNDVEPLGPPDRREYKRAGSMPAVCASEKRPNSADQNA